MDHIVFFFENWARVFYRSEKRSIYCEVEWIFFWPISDKTVSWSCLGTQKPMGTGSWPPNATVNNPERKGRLFLGGGHWGGGTLRFPLKKEWSAQSKHLRKPSGFFNVSFVKSRFSCRFVPVMHFRKHSAKDGTYMGLNIGEDQGLALIQGQIYNPDFGFSISVSGKT